MFELAGLSVSPAWLIALGLGAGILSGLLGVGGGILLTPALHILGMSMPVAVATSLTQMVGTSLSGSIKHARNRHVSFPLALLFGLPSILGVTLGKRLLVNWPRAEADRFLSLLYIVMMLYLAWTLIKSLRSGMTARVSPDARRVWDFGPRWTLGLEGRSVALLPVFLAGAGVGLLSSLTGLGGGFFYIPALMYLGGCSMKQAVGTSLATVFVSSTYGAIVYGLTGLSHLPAALCLMGGSIAGAQIGATAAHRAQDQRLKILFLFLIISAMLSMILERFGWTLLAEFLLFGSGLLIIALAIIGTFLWSDSARK